MKKIFLIAALVLATTGIFAATPPEVNAKVLKAFNETFKDIKEVNWQEHDNYYEVAFKQDEIQNRVRYDTEGNIIGTIRYYPEEKLPPVIIAKLKKKYKTRSVHYVTEISTETEFTYHIIMEDEKHWYTVKADAVGNLEQTDKFNKPKAK